MAKQRVLAVYYACTMESMNFTNPKAQGCFDQIKYNDVCVSTNLFTNT